MKPRRRLTESDEDHLRAIYDAGGAERQVSMGTVARVAGHSPATVTTAAKRLLNMGLVEYEKYRGVRLTEPGMRIALEMVRHHRLIESFLVEFLGYDWNAVHEEADRLEHAISEELERRIAARVADPTIDPHGDPIPGETLQAVRQDTHPLSNVKPNSFVEVARVSDRDPEILAYLGEVGLVPGAEIEVIEHMPFHGPVAVRMGHAVHHFGRPIANSVFVHIKPTD